jgi:phage gp16-like protein
MSKVARDNRNRDITLIQIGRRQLCLTDENYYAIIRAQGGAESSKDLDAIGRAKVLAYLTRLGFKPTSKPGTPKRPRRPDPAPDRKPLVRRIRAQLISLGHKPDEYADGIVKQMLGAEAPEYFEWCEPRDLYKLSQALGVEQQRRGAATS